MTLFAEQPATSLSRRSFLGGIAAAALSGGGATAQTQSWRGVVGMIKPTLRPGSLEELIRLLPEGIGVIPLFLDINRGTAEEFESVIPAYEQNVARLAAQHCDIIHPEGAPPFMVQGFKREAELVAAWEEKYKTPIFTASQNQVTAMKALKVKTILGATYFSGDINRTYAKYFEDAGFVVRGMDGIEGLAFKQVQDISSRRVYAHIRQSFLAHKGADAIYMLGSAWRTLDIIDLLEQDLQVPVIHPVAARAWEIQKRLHVNQPVKGFGHLLADLPALPPGQG